MEFKLVFSVTTVFEKVVAESATGLILLVVLALVFYRLICQVGRACAFDAGRSEEDFCFSVEFIDHIAQIFFIK